MAVLYAEYLSGHAASICPVSYLSGNNVSEEPGIRFLGGFYSWFDQQVNALQITHRHTVVKVMSGMAMITVDKPGNEPVRFYGPAVFEHVGRRLGVKTIVFRHFD